MAASAEDQVVTQLRRRLQASATDLLGDDAALLGNGLAVTVDQQVEGTHFLLGIPPALIARRLVAVTLSDLAAVGAQPRYAFLALTATPGYRIQTFLKATEKALRGHSCLLAGGDMARGERLSASLTAIGKRSPRRRWVRRSTAVPGDRLWVGGSLGDSAIGRILLARGAEAVGRTIKLPAGLGRDRADVRAARRAVTRHLQPEPQLPLGDWLARRRRAAAIDVSDGLLLDLKRLCSESGVGAVVDAPSLPSAPGSLELAEQLGENLLDLALTGGEDYVLLFALPATVRPPDSFRCTAIGEIRSGRKVEVRGHRPSGIGGWDHLRAF